LVETIVATAIIAIAAVTMVAAFMTMGNIALKSTSLNNSDESLENSIATDATPSDTQSYNMQFSDGTNSYSIPGTVSTYTDSSTGTSFSLFSMASTS
jgi:hypothetical protein